jgi:hypothetical protein
MFIVLGCCWFSVILFLQFLGEMSIGDLDIFCGSVCRDHVTDAVAAHLCHAASNAPVAFGFLMCFHLALDRKDQIGADVADIGEVEGLGFLIFHAVSIPWTHKKIEKKMWLGETFFCENVLTAVEPVLVRVYGYLRLEPTP